MKRIFTPVLCLLFITSALMAQPELVINVNGTSSGSIPNYSSGEPVVFTAINKVFFIADDDVIGDQIWVTDNANSGATAIFTIPGGAGDISQITEWNGNAYFIIDDTEYQLWKTDGTAGGTVKVKDIGSVNIDHEFPMIFPTDDHFFFMGNDATNGTEVWKSDGTAGGTLMVKDINTGTENGVSSGENAYAFNNSLFFIGNDGTEYGLFISDGTAGGTEILKIDNISPGEFDQCIVMNNTLYLMGGMIIKSDGTKTGTTFLYDFSNLPDTICGLAQDGAEPAIMNGKIYFEGVMLTDVELDTNGTEIEVEGDEEYEHRLFSTDGTAEGTKLIKDIDCNSTVNMVSTGNKVLFIGYDASGKELWSTDGTEAGTKIVKDFKAGMANGITKRLTKVGNYVCFAAATDSFGLELAQYDIANNFAVMVADLSPGSNYFGLSGSDVTHMVDLNGTAFFRASTDTSTRELWKYTPYYIEGVADTTSSDISEERISNKDQKSFIIYPNPASNNITLNIPESIKEKYTISVFSILGEQVYYSENLNESASVVMDVAEFNNGIYIIEIASNDDRYFQKLQILK